MRAAQGSGEQARVAQALLDWRHYRQRQNMFGEEWQRKYVVASPTGHRVHGKFWQLGTNTGRYASSEPNLQQVPSDMKACYGGHEGLVIGKSDFSGLEIRVAASIAEDAALVEAFNNGEDIHRLVASAGFGKPIDEITSEERKIAKAMSFTWLFGGSVQTFMDYASANGSHVDWETANRAYVNFFRRFEGLSDFRNQAHLICNTKRAFVLRYPTGLKRLLEGRELIPTILLNNYVQGYAAAGMKYAILEAHRRGISPYLCATVHDELVYAAPQEQIVDLTREIQECMVLGMKEALRDGSNISIAVESTWGPTWVGLPENVTHYEE